MSDPQTDGQTESVETSRRAFLKTAGKIVVYAPPVMLGMSSPSFATGDWNKSGVQYSYYPKSEKKFDHFFKKNSNKHDD